MDDRNVVPGDVLVITLPSHFPGGREQEGNRPAIVVGIPKGFVRYPVVVVVPLTTQAGVWPQKNPELYQRISKGEGGIPKNSIALIDQVRAVDIHRVKSFLGSLEELTYSSIRVGLLKLFQGLL